MADVSDSPARLAPAQIDALYRAACVAAQRVRQDNDQRPELVALVSAVRRYNAWLSAAREGTEPHAIAPANRPRPKTPMGPGQT